MALQAFPLSPANPNSLIEITPKNFHRYPSPITRDMIQRPQDPSATVAPGVPVLASISPTTATAGTEDFIVKVFGSGFYPTSIITIGGADVETDFVNPGELQTTVTPVAGVFAFKVRNGASVSVATGTLTVT